MMYHPAPDLFYVYLVVSADGTFYTGLTDDLKQRFSDLVNGRGTMSDSSLVSPLRLKYFETLADHEAAIERRKQLEAFSTTEKENLVSNNEPILSLIEECNQLEEKNSAKGDNKPLRADIRQKRIGILGGGQLGRMLLQAA